jgi:hypothetical protein
MIKIIKHGHKPLEAECPCCGCVFLFTINDLKTGINKLDAWEYINCPECNYCLTWRYGEKSGKIRS